MNKTRITIIVLVLVIIAGLTYVLVNKEKRSDVTTGQPEKITVSEQPATEKVSNASQLGKYVAYSATEAASAKGDKLLFFHAPWCPQCRDLDASIKASSLPDNLTIFKVDYDTNQALRIKYGVTIQTTIVKINDKGEKIESYVAYDKPNFMAVEQALLK